MGRFLPLVLVAGCAFDRSGIGADDAPPIDAPPGEHDAAPPGIDAPPGDARPPCVTWDALNVDPCDAALPDPDILNLASGQFRYDTDTGVLSDGNVTVTPASAVLPQDDGPELRVLNALSFNLDPTGSLEVTGARPLVIVVHGNASIAGTIDVSAQAGDEPAPGPGGNAAECGTGAEPGDPASNATAGGGGGGGGGFGDDGGDGGDGQGGGHGAKGAKGGKNGTETLQPLRGGCAGGDGGDDGVDAGDEGGRAGDGGGALEITARGTIQVSGTIRARGAGGTAAQLAKAGGGGGGSGGAILVDAEIATLTVTAVLCANGGGGGEGGQTLEVSENGEPATCSETVAAQGGDFSAGGGNGGDGGRLGALKGESAANGASGGGGGGGGGGVGRIRVRGRTTRDVPDAAVVSPAALP